MLNKLNILILSTIALIIVIVVSMKYPYNIKAPCLITAQIEWALIQVEADKMLSRMLDNSNDKISHFTILQYDREDFIQLILKSMPGDPYIVNKGDTIARIYSTDNQIILANLKAELEIARANLATVSSGEKEALQEEAHHAFKMAKIELDAYEPQYQRKKELYEQKLIGVEEWEIAKSTYNLYQSNKLKEKARLNALQSGEKQEMIQYFRAQIDQRQVQVELMKRKLSLESIRAPIRGILTYTKGDSFICQVDQIDTLLLKIPVPAEEIKYILPGQKVSFYIYETGKNYTALVINIGQRSQIINGKSMYMITAFIQRNGHQLTPGMSGYAKIHGEKVTFFTLLIRAFNRSLGLRYF